MAGILAILSTQSPARAADLVDEANELVRAGKYSEALSTLDKAQKDGKKLESIKYLRGLCYQNQGQTEKAKEEFSWLYYKAASKTLRYKAWTALKSLASAKTAQSTKQQPATKTAQAGPGADAWVTPGSGYGKSGAEAYSTSKVIVHPTTCSRRGR